MKKNRVANSNIRLCMWAKGVEGGGGKEPGAKNLGQKAGGIESRSEVWGKRVGSRGSGSGCREGFRHQLKKDNKMPQRLRDSARGHRSSEYAITEI